MNKEPIMQSPAVRQIADIDFSEIYKMSGLKYQEYQIWKDKEDIIVESILMERFPSLDYHHFQTNILPCVNMGGVLFHFKQKPVSSIGSEFIKDITHTVGTVWEVEPCADEFNSYLEFLYRLFAEGTVSAITNEAVCSEMWGEHSPVKQ